MFLCLRSASADTPTPTPTSIPAVALSDAAQRANNERLLFDKQGTLHLVWDETRPSGNDIDVLHRQLAPNGTWSNADNLTDGFETVFPDSNRLLLNPAGIVCVFFDGALQLSGGVGLGLYQRCLENGIWTEPKFVKQTPGTHRDDEPTFAPDGSVKTLYLASAGDLFFENIKLSDDQASAFQPAFVTDSNGAYHAFWTRQGNPYTLVHRYSADGGQTWSSPESLDPSGTSSGSQLGVTSDAQGRVHLVWQSLQGRIYYRRWNANSGWAEPVDVRGDVAGNNAVTFGIAAAPNGLAAITWQGIENLLYVEQRADNTFTAPTNLGVVQSNGVGPQVAIDSNGTRHFVFQEQNPNPRLFYATLNSLIASPVTAPAVLGLQYTSPFFKNHIHDPSILVSASPATLVTNFALALLLALAMGFFGNLLNDTLESNEERVAQMLGPFNRWVRRARDTTHQIETNLNARRLHWFTTTAKIAGLLILLGVIYAFVDPAFDPTRPDALLAIAALTLSVGVIGLADDLAQYVFLRRHGESPALRVHAGNAVLALLSALGSRVFQITPGILLGSPAGIEDVRESRLDTYLHFIAMGSVAVVALAAWFFALLASANLFLVTILLLIFAVGVQSLFFEMLPLSQLHGKSIFQFNRLLWLALLAVVGWLFITTMLNPDGEFLGSFNQPDMVTVSVLVALFCLFSTAVWIYFNATNNK